MTERQKQASITRQKIIKSARDLISQNGYDSVSVDDIVANCGIAKGTFYHHFKTKEDIVIYLSDSIYDDLQKDEGKLSRQTFMERIHCLIIRWYQEVDTLNLHIARETLKFYMNAKTIDPTGKKLSHMENGISLFRRIMTDAVNAGELSKNTPVMILSQAIMFALQGSALYHCEQEEAFLVMDWCEKFIENAVDPLLKPYLLKEGAAR